MAFDFPTAPAVDTLYQPAGGPVYKYNGSVWNVVTLQGVNSLPGFIQQQFITVSGAINLHADTKYFLVELQGGGANGGLGNAAAVNNASASGGGGSGAYCSKWVIRPAGYSASCVIGAATVLSGGSNGNASAYNDNFGNITAGGGLVGGTGLTTPNPYTISGGDGGVASSNVGAMALNGQKGGWSFAVGFAGGGTSRGGMGADSRFGSGGMGLGYGGAGSNSHGGSSFGYGAGGGGGYAVNNYGSYGGGAGGAGLLVITEFR